ncbi:hypothetical protein AAII07_17840 [Microvirga sp. 0TCS3.31]
MTLDISFQPMRVLIDGHDSEGNLILADGQLAAVIVRLDGLMTPSTRGFGTLRQASANAMSVSRHPCSRRPRRPEPGLNKS